MVTQGETIEHVLPVLEYMASALFASNRVEPSMVRLAAMDRSLVCDFSMVCLQSLSGQSFSQNWKNTPK
jgi:hypothetical protein